MNSIIVIIVDGVKSRRYIWFTMLFVRVPLEAHDGGVLGLKYSWQYETKYFLISKYLLIYNTSRGGIVIYDVYKISIDMFVKVSISIFIYRLGWVRLGR